MLFLYRIQNDPLETASFNAFQAEGNSLSDLAEGLGEIFQQEFHEHYSWRLRKSDSAFGYVWRDVSEREFGQALEGEMVMVRLLRVASLLPSGERLPARFVGTSNAATKAGNTSSKSTGDVAKKRPQTAVQPEKVQEPVDSKPSVFNEMDDMFEKPTVAPPTIESSTTLPDETDGISSEERAQIRIAEREKQEQAEMERKVQEARDADAAQTQLADAKFKSWTELRPKLEKWSGTEKERKPIRTLLCTLHTVLWEGAKWAPSSVIVRPNEVRLAFRKAMLVVHPDKIPSGSSASVQVIAKYCFENLNAAYEKFEATELKPGN